MIQRDRASVVCVDQGRLLAVRLAIPGTGQSELFLPGGGVEAGEAPAATAVREALEETGYDVVVDTARVRTARYEFPWGKDTYDCTTHFFPARLADSRRLPQAVHDADFNLGTVWVPLADVPRLFGYHAAILAEIQALLPAAPFRSFADFWPHYVREHADARNRKLHAVGSTLVLALLGTAIATRRWSLLAALPVCGYAFAWCGHFFVEKNRPATFTNPFYSLLADFKMLSFIAAGRMDAEVARACSRVPAREPLSRAASRD